MLVSLHVARVHSEPDSAQAAHRVLLCGGAVVDKTTQLSGIFPRPGPFGKTAQMVAALPPSPPAIVRAWSRALNANDNKAAAALFARGARVIQPGVDVRLTPRLALAFNASLPCGGKITELRIAGDTVTATFLLTERPRHTCDAPGKPAAARFVVRKGLIVRWQQVPVPPPKRPPALA